MTKISEIVSINSKAVLSNAIQLSWYSDPTQKAENDRLASGFVFGNGVNRRVGAHVESSSLPVFESIRDAFGNPQASNIFTVVANYGHGKSHFALVLANYFGQQADSPTIADIIKHIETCSDNATADHFRHYKKQTAKPHLVVTLSGHEFQDLRQGFLRGLRRALDANESTRNHPIKSISTNAATWLRSLDQVSVARADSFLGERHNTDIDSLLNALDNFESGKEHVLKELSRELNGIEADFGANVNLKEVIKDVVDTFCSGSDAPFHRLLILFDELGIYAEKWCHNRTAAGGLAPQEIFEACSDRRGKVCFVGFVQRELGEFVKGFPIEVQTEFQKWAGRMLPDAVYLLVSNLEEVISKLIVKKEKWKQVIADYAPRLIEESTLARESIQRYNNTWDSNSFYNTVTRDCFPLHPLTTGILCSFDFTQGSRTIIGAVDSMLKRASTSEVNENGRPRWIRAVDLVGEFESSFRQKESRDFASYEYAVSNSLTTDADKVLFDVLQALFLFKEVRMTKQNRYEHAEILAPLAGYSVSETKDALQRLQNDYDAVRYSVQRREYEFTGIGSSRVVVLDMARLAIVGKNVNGLAKALGSLDVLKTLNRPESEAREFKAEFGVEGDEWCLDAHYIDAIKLSSDEVKRLCKLTSDEGKARGIVINLISASAPELEEARKYADVVISELKQQEHLFPFIIGVPREPATQLEKHLLVKDYLVNGMSQPHKVQFADSHRAALEFINKELNEELITHLRSIEYVVPSHLGLKFGNRKQSLDEIADALFAESYKSRPPSNSVSMKPTATRGNSATAEIAKQLILNELNFDGLSTEKQTIVKQVLLEGANKWGILDSNYRIREPKNSRVKEGWSLLSKSVSKDGWTTFDRILSKLAQPPFGYDDYTATFLVAAWIGKHKHELGFKDSRQTSGFGTNARGERNVPLNELQGNLNKSKEFIRYLRSYISVQHSGQAVQLAARNFLAQIQNVQDVKGGENLLEQTERILQTLAPGDALISQIEAASKELEVWLVEAKSVEKSLSQYKQIIAQSEDLEMLLRTQAQLTAFGAKNGMQSNAAFIENLNLLDNKIDGVARSQSQIKLERIESFDSLKEKFEGSKKALRKHNRIDLEQLFDAALDRIESDYSRLSAKVREQPIINELNAIKVTGMPLAYLLEQSERVASRKKEPISSQIEKLANSKHAELAEEIERLRNFIDQLSSRVEIVGELSAAESLGTEILRNEFLYKNTNESETLSGELEKLGIRIAELKDKEAQDKAAEEMRRRREIEVLTAQNISKEFQKISNVDQRFSCLKEMLNPKNDLGFSEEQKSELRSLLD